MNGGNGVIKVLVGKTHREILGVHIYGPRATDLISEACLAVGMEATSDEVLATIHGPVSYTHLDVYKRQTPFRYWLFLVSS